MYPEYVTTRPVVVPPSVEHESGRPLRMEVTVSADRSLVWVDTGWQFRTVTRAARGETGTSVTVVLPVTDVVGWKTDDGALLDPLPGEHTHSYTFTFRYFDQRNDEVTHLRRVVKGVPVPSGGDPARFDEVAELATTEAPAAAFFWNLTPNLPFPVQAAVNDWGIDLSGGLIRFYRNEED